MMADLDPWMALRERVRSLPARALPLRPLLEPRSMEAVG